MVLPCKLMDFAHLRSTHEKGCLIDWLPLVIHIPESTGDRDHALAANLTMALFIADPPKPK